MVFTSTRDRTATAVPFLEAILTGLAPDGGLYHPTEEPDLSLLFASFSADTPFVDIAAATTVALFPDEFRPEDAQRLAERAFTFPAPIVPLETGHEILELFHGPSCAFKDFGASFLAASMETALERRDRRAIILTATSGDTGSAVAQAYHGRDHLDVVILYPSGRVSPLQEKQLTTLGGNVMALEIQGSFDDCQRLVKQAFLDPDLARALPLTSANSINVGRLIPQSFYYIYAAVQIRDRDGRPPVFCVPSGNFGNLTAGLLAWRWGLPVEHFIAATNANDVVPAYLRDGVYVPRPSIATLANAMDVGDPSNFERMSAIFGAESARMASAISGFAATDAEIAEVMRQVYHDRGMPVCPHTAAGIHAARQFPQRDSTIVTLATAHPAKFLEVSREAVGVEPELPDRLARLMDLPKRATLLKPRLEDLRATLMATFA